MTPAYLLSPLSLVTHPVIQGWGGYFVQECECNWSAVMRALLRRSARGCLCSIPILEWEQDGRRGRAETPVDDRARECSQRPFGTGSLKSGRTIQSIELGPKLLQRTWFGSRAHKVPVRFMRPTRSLIASKAVRWPSDEEKALLSASMSAPTT